MIFKNYPGRDVKALDGIGTQCSRLRILHGITNFQLICDLALQRSVTTIMYLTLKFVHVSCAMLTISGFLLRGYWMMSGSGWSHHRVTKIAPHVIDTLFLAAGIALVFEMHIQVMQHGWLLAKFAGLIAYIVLGLFALRLGRTPESKAIAFVAAVCLYAYIVGVALSKSAGSWLAFFA